MREPLYREGRKQSYDGARLRVAKAVLTLVHFARGGVWSQGLAHLALVTYTLERVGAIPLRSLQ